MKKKFLSIVTLLSLFAIESNAQLQMSIGAGYNFNQHPIYSLNAGYEMQRININGGFQRSLTRATSSTIIAGAEIGYDLINSDKSLIVSAGYWHVGYNTDQKAELASWKPSLSIRGITMLSENGGLFANAMYLKNNFSIQAGMLIKFN